MYGQGAEAVKGTCRTMCPHEEIRFREANNLLVTFEMMDYNVNEGSPKFKADPSKCVKEFRRSAAGEVINNPKCLRPGPVLIKTVDYLFEEIAPRRDVPFQRIYDFVFDRLRSIRQDMVIQQLQRDTPHVAVHLLEQCCRFYLYSSFLMKVHPKIMINKHINRTHLLECLSALVDMYCQIHEARTDASEHLLQNCAEFLSCYLLCNTHSDEAIQYVLISFSTVIRNTEPLRTAMELSVARLHRNHVRLCKCFVKLLQGGWFLTAFSHLDSLDKQRTDALSVLSRSHNSKVGGVPAVVLGKWLLLADVEDIKAVSALHGMETNAAGNVIMLKSQFVTPDVLKVQESLLCSYCNDSSIIAKTILSV